MSGADFSQQQELEHELQQRIEEALAHAAEHTVTDDEVRLLAYAAGVKYQPKEKL